MWHSIFRDKPRERLWRPRDPILSQRRSTEHNDLEVCSRAETRLETFPIKESQISFSKDFLSVVLFCVFL